LAYETFLEFNAKDYTENGCKNFKNFVKGEELYKQFAIGNYMLVVANYEDKMVGMLLIREKKHVALLFVDGAYHHMGIGHALIGYAKEYVKKNKKSYFVSVNASPYAVKFYEREGFKDVKMEQFEDGIRFIPMKLKL